MNNFDQQTSNDLEFDIIRLMLHDYCSSQHARLQMVDLAPIKNFKKLHIELHKSNEFKKIRTEGHTFPAIAFEELDNEIELMSVKNSALSRESFLKILDCSRITNDILQFFKKKEDEFPKLYNLLTDVYYTKDIIKAIESVFDQKGDIKDDATTTLLNIRTEIKSVRRRISRNFNKTLKQYRESGWLAETGEAFLNERRVLAVISTYKRKVGGNVIGSSKTGNWTYIEPQINVESNFELEMLHDDERNEIRKILQDLTKEISEHLPLIVAYNVLLCELDFIQAKTRLAIQLNANLPGIDLKESRLELIKAYHPLLLLTNKKEGLDTHPQSLVMDKFSRMLVISGPNAGGKSITLKTVGLLQIMLQSGILIPVDPSSKMCFFHDVLSDIGDNQSIENQLSTYSYRLKRMKHFLEVANRRTLLLLDEFGTGSDPELGGALAEVFFEKLYSKKCFGVITTHYSNIKMKAAELRNAINGCMLFDLESLEPMYKLSVGQPGSSFTFEVAQINGIDDEIIEKAKAKLDTRKVKLDKIIADLQKEKSKVESINLKLLEAESRAKKAESSFDSKRGKFDERLKTQQTVIERNNKYMSSGKKMNQFIREYNSSGNNRQLMAEVKKHLAIEKNKIEEEKLKLKAKEKTGQKKKVRKKRKANIAKIEVGSMVKLLTGRETGTVLELDTKMATVAFGVFKTRVELTKLIFIR